MFNARKYMKLLLDDPDVKEIIKELNEEKKLKSTPEPVSNPMIREHVQSVIDEWIDKKYWKDEVRTKIVDQIMSAIPNNSGDNVQNSEQAEIKLKLESVIRAIQLTEHKVGLETLKEILADISIVSKTNWNRLLNAAYQGNQRLVEENRKLKLPNPMIKKHIVAEVKELLEEYLREEISLSRFVEKLNENHNL